MRVGRAATLVLLASIVMACSAPPAPTPPPATPTAPAATPSATAATVPIRVRFRGRVNCNIGFSYYCSPSLSVLDADNEVPEAFRPAATDPTWSTRGDDMQNVKASQWTPLRGAAATSPGRHLLVVSLIGTSDVASYNPDGTVATELVGRCSAEVDVAPADAAVQLVVTFRARPETTAAACTIEVDGD